MSRFRSSRRLLGRTILLSASVPDPERDERFFQIPDAAFQIEQAVVSLARAVFAAGGRLAFGGHPSISPLVALIAGEYRSATYAESLKERAPPQVTIYQSEVFREWIPQDTDLLIRLGLAEEHWVPAAVGESYKPGAGSAHRQCPKSLLAMRARMIEETAPAAMVCIGGMEGVIAEAAMFACHGPVFALARTGGAAFVLAQEEKAMAIDRQVIRDAGLAEDDAKARDGDEVEVFPYPLIMQTIVDRIAPPSEWEHHHE